MKSYWGIDLGGTKIEGVVLQIDEGIKVLARRRIATEADKGYEHIIGRMQELVQLLKEETGQVPDKIGIGTPGAIDTTTGTLKNSNTLCLNGQPFKEDLEKALGIPVALANDANCFALAEAKLGSVAENLPDAAVVFGVIMGTGVGGGIVVNGQVVNGKQGIAGEWGHNFLDESGGPCYCGRIGCVEMVISGPALERYYKSISGKELKLKEIVALHISQSDPHATATIQRLIYFFGKAIANVINILDPDAIVLGGGVGNIDFLYTEGLEEAKKYIFNTRPEILLLKPSLGDSAGVFGAASLVM
jgi:fructokinase